MVVGATSEETEENLQELTESLERIKDSQRKLEEMTSKSFTYIMSDYDAIMNLSKTLNINATQARQQLQTFPSEYIVDGQTIPDLVKKMRKAKRKLKGDTKVRMAKAIDTVIDGYSDHISKCIDSIYWIKDYKTPLLKMRFNEKDLQKINKISSLPDRRNLIDSLCKMWEASLKQNNMAYSNDYAKLEKEIRLARKDFRAIIKGISDQSLLKSKKERTFDFVLETICENPGIGIGELYDRLPSTLHKSATPKIIKGMIKKMEVVSVEGAHYKVPEPLKKNIWAYTAAFIDSDGYITLDRNMNPRVGLVATGERGKAFMEEMHKSIGYGRMHLDQKSPQDTRLINRLNFYSQADVTDLLTKCLPHFRLKKGNAKLLLELIRMKKSYKKADWYKGRCDEIFKLMKWENHKDHVGFDWLKEGIYLDNIQKYQDNCKMSVMDSMEQIGTIIKQQERTFVITEVDYDTDEHEQDDLDTTYQQMAVTAKELDIDDDADADEIQNVLVDWITDTTGWHVKSYSYHEVRPDGTKINMDGKIIKTEGETADGRKVTSTPEEMTDYLTYRNWAWQSSKVRKDAGLTDEGFDDKEHLELITTPRGKPLGYSPKGEQLKTWIRTWNEEFGKRLDAVYPTGDE